VSLNLLNFFFAENHLDTANVFLRCFAGKITWYAGHVSTPLAYAMQPQVKSWKHKQKALWK